MNKNWDKKLFKAMVKDQFYSIDNLKKNMVYKQKQIGKKH